MPYIYCGLFEKKNVMQLLKLICLTIKYLNIGKNSYGARKLLFVFFPIFWLKYKTKSLHFFYMNYLIKMI